MKDTDAVIAEIRRARCEISRRYKHDVYKYVKHLMRKEAEGARREENQRKAPARVRSAAPAHTSGAVRVRGGMAANGAPASRRPMPGDVMARRRKPAGRRRSIGDLHLLPSPVSVRGTDY